MDSKSDYKDCKLFYLCGRWKRNSEKTNIRKEHAFRNRKIRIRNLKTLQINNFRTSRRKMKIVKFLHHIISHSFWKRTEEFSKYLVAVALTVTEH